MIIRTRLAVVPGYGPDAINNIVVEDVELAEPGDYDVRLKVMTCTVCNSDILALTGEHGEYDGPGAAGHETAGIVDAVGSKVTYVKPGDRVLCSIVRAGCGTCIQCLNNRPWFCLNNPPMSFRIASPFTRLNGEAITQTLSGSSGFAEYTNAHEAMLCKIDDDIPFEIGSVLSCGFMSGFGTVLNRSKVQPCESFAVVGCGGVGLSAIMGAKYCGALPIIGIDTVDSKLEAALRFGATHVFNPKKCDVVAEVKKITGGFGADQTLVAVAGPHIKKMTLDLTAEYGQLTIVGHGHYNHEYMDEINWFDLLFGRRLTGCVMGNVLLRKDIPEYMDMYRKGIVDIDSLLTNRFTFDEIKEALIDSTQGALKNVVYIGEEIPAEKRRK